MIEMSIDSLRVGLMNPKSTQHGTPYVVLLKEKTAEHTCPSLSARLRLTLSPSSCAASRCLVR